MSGTLVFIFLLSWADDYLHLYASAHLVMRVNDWLFIQSSPILWLVALAHFQQIASDGAPSLIQRSRPPQDQRAVPHLPELQVIWATWANMHWGNKRGVSGSLLGIYTFSGTKWAQTTVSFKLICIHQWSYWSQDSFAILEIRRKTFRNLPPVASGQHEVHLLNDFWSLLNY